MILILLAIRIGIEQTGVLAQRAAVGGHSVRCCVQKTVAFSITLVDLLFSGVKQKVDAAL
jgi:hypothetical protein